MTDTTLPPGGEAADRIEPVDIQHEMQRSYIDYAMSVIVGRALPEVRDGLKPVHRRVLYAMFDSGFRPDRGHAKSARSVAETMGNYHPHGDASIYDTLVRMAQPWSLRYPLVDGQGNFGSPGNDPPAAMRYTEARLTPLAMEMLREIDEETVDFIPNYDGRVQEPTVLPSRFPNLLANGSGGIAVGMATNIPPHNLRELAEAVYWCLDNHEADEEATLAAVCERVKGPDFPTHGLIVGSQGIHDAYTTGRGSVRMRGVVEVEEDSRGRTSLVITELPYQVNHDNFITSIAEQVRDGKLAGISNIEDQSSDRVGLRIVVEIKRDAVAKVVLNNLYKHTQLQTSFGANMLSIVDGVPRTLRIDQMIRYYVEHQLDVIIRRTTYRLRKANERAHILRGLVKALDALDEVIALIRASETVDIARAGLIELLDIDEIQSQAILDMQLRRLAALERQRIIDDLAKIEAEIADLEDILAKPERQRAIVHDELAEIVDKHGDDRRTRIIAADGDVNDEDLIAREDVVVTITETGYAKRTKTDLYRSQKRGGKGVQGAGLEAGRHRAALLCVLDARLDPVLHHPGPGVPGQGVRPAGSLPHRARTTRRQPAGLPARGADRSGHPDQELRGRALPGAGHPQRPGQEDQADRLRLEPVRRHRGGQSARRRRAGRRRAVLLRGGSAAGLGQRPVDPVLGDRRRAASDGPCDLGCAGHAVQHR